VTVSDVLGSSSCLQVTIYVRMQSVYCRGCNVQGVMYSVECTGWSARCTQNVKGKDVQRTISERELHVRIYEIECAGWTLECGLYMMDCAGWNGQGGISTGPRLATLIM